MTVHAIQVNLADHELAQRAELLHDGAARDGFFRAIDPSTRPTEMRVETSVDGSTWGGCRGTCGTNAERPHALFCLTEARTARDVRVTAGEMPCLDAPFAVSGLRVFGKAHGDFPQEVVVQPPDPMLGTARIEWDPVEDAQGYNARYGVDPNKLLDIDSGCS